MSKRKSESLTILLSMILTFFLTSESIKGMFKRTGKERNQGSRIPEGIPNQRRKR